MFKFIHTADIHIDSPIKKTNFYDGVNLEQFQNVTRRSFDNLIAFAVSEKVDFVLIAGDLYDGDWNDYNTGLYIVQKMNRLRDAGIRVFVVAGNHDAQNKMTKTLRFPENVFFFPSDKPMTQEIEGIDVAIHGQSFASSAVTNDLSAQFPDRLDSYFNIGILHTSLNGREGHEPYAPCSLRNLLIKDYDYWALGHVHRYEIIHEKPVIVFPGNTQGRHAREIGEKGCLLVSVDEYNRPTLSFKALDVVRWTIMEVDVSSMRNVNDVLDIFQEELLSLNKKNSEMPMSVRVVIKGKTLMCNEILSSSDQWVNEIRSVSLDIGDGNIWIEQVKFNLEFPDDFHKTRFREGSIGELITFFDEIKENKEFKESIREELAFLFKRLPKEFLLDAEFLNFYDDAFIDNLLSSVEPILMNRLLGGKKYEN